MADRRSWLRMPPAGPTQGAVTTAPPLPTPGGGGGSVSYVGLALPPDVFLVTDSPIVGSGTLTGSFIAQAAHTALMAPEVGSGIPAFRLITTADIVGNLASDVTGSLLNNRVERIWNRPVDSSAPVLDDMLRWDGAQWQVYPGVYGVGAANRVTYWTASNRIGSTPSFQFDGSSVLSLTTNYINGPVRIETQNTVGTGTGTAEVRTLNNAAAGIALRVSGATTSSTRYGASLASVGRLELDGAANALMISTVNRDVPIIFGVDNFEIARFGTDSGNSYTGYLRINSTTGATGLNTGALRVLGGASVSENLYVGSNATVVGAGSYGGRLTTAASGGLRLLPGPDPVTMVDGLVWLTSAAMFARVNGITYQLTSGSLSGAGIANQMTYWSGATTLVSSARNIFDPYTGNQTWGLNSNKWLTAIADGLQPKTRITYDMRAFEITSNNNSGQGNTFGGCDTYPAGWTHPGFAGPGFTPFFRYGMNYEVGRHQFTVGEDLGNGSIDPRMTFSIGLDYVQVHTGRTPTATSAVTGGFRVSTDMGVAGKSFFGARAEFVTSTTGTAAFRVPHGVDPSVGNLADGDFWTTTLGAYIRLNGSTVLLASSSGTLSGSAATNQVTFWSGVISITGEANFTYLNSVLTIATSSNAFKGYVAQTSAVGAGATTGLLAQNTAGTVIANAGVWTGTTGSSPSQVITQGSARFTAEGTALAGVYYGAESNVTAFTVPITFVVGSSIVADFSGRGTTSPTWLSDGANAFRLYYTADSVSSTTGSFITPGGAYIAKTLRLGGLLQLPASTTSGAAINFGVGGIPTAPVDGDMWSTSTGFYVRVNGGTRLLSPAAILTGTGAPNQVSYWIGTSSLNGNANYTYDPAAGILTVAHSTVSTDYTTGAFVLAGGAGIAGKLNVQAYVGVGTAVTGSEALVVYTPSTRAATFIGGTSSAEIEIRQSSAVRYNVRFGVSSDIGFVGSFSAQYSSAQMHFDIYSDSIRRLRLGGINGSLLFGHTTTELTAHRVNLWHASGVDIVWAVQRDAQTSGTYDTLGRWRQESQSDRLATTMPDSALGDRYFTVESRTLNGSVKVLTAVHNDGRLGIARLPTAYRLEAEDGQPVAWLSNTFNGADKVSLILHGTTALNRNYTGLRFTHDTYTTGWGADIFAKDEGTFKTSLLFYTNAGTASTSVPTLSMSLLYDGRLILAGELFTVASAAARSGLNLAPGIDPTAPVNGDLWLTATGIYARINGATVNLTGGGGGGGSGVAGQVTVWAAPTVTGGSTALTFGSGRLNISDAASAETRWTATGATAATATLGAAVVNVGSVASWFLRSYDAAGASVRDNITVTHGGVITLAGATTLGSTLAVTGDATFTTTAIMPVLHLNPGAAPVAPTNGDTWATPTDLFVRLGGVSRQITGGVIGSGTINTLTYWSSAATAAAVATSAYDSSAGQIVFTAAASPEVLKFVSGSAGAPVGLEYQVSGGRRWLVGVDSGATGWVAGTGYYTIRDRTTSTNRLSISATDGALAILSDAAATSTVAGGFSMLGLATFSASASARAMARFTAGADPTTPVDGDFWYTASGLFVRSSGVSVNLLASSGGLITASAFSMPTSRLLGRTSSGTGSIETITVGSGLTLAGGILTASGGGGGGGSSGTANIWTALNTFTGGVVISGAPYLNLDDILQAVNPTVAKGTLFVNTGLPTGVVTGLWYSGGATNYQIPGMTAANVWTATNVWTGAANFNALATFNNGIRITGASYLLLDSIGGASNPTPTAGTIFVNFGATGALTGLFFRTNTGTVQVGALETDNVWTGSNTFNGAMTPTGSLSLGSSFSPSITTWDAGAGAYTIAASVNFLVNSAGSTTAAATVTFPVTPAGRQQIVIAAGGFAITALTLSPSAGYTILGATTTLAANTSVEYVLNGTVWTRVR